MPQFGQLDLFRLHKSIQTVQGAAHPAATVRTPINAFD